MSGRDTTPTGSGSLEVAAHPAGLPLTPSEDPCWLIVEEGFTLAREHEIESIFAIANGYVGVRASLEEGSRLSQPGSFAAGVFVDDPGTNLGPALAVLPDWPRLEIAVDGERLSIESGEMLEHRRMLDLRQGVLWRDWRQQDPSGRITRVRILRLASLADRHILLQSIEVTAENYSGQVSLVGDGLAIPAHGREGVLDIAHRPSTVAFYLGDTSVAMATGSAPPNLRQKAPSDRLDERWSWETGLGKSVRLDRAFSIFTSRDLADPLNAARLHLATVLESGPMAIAAAHVDAWADRWRAADVRIIGDDETQRAIRFAAYHLTSAANPADEFVSVGARGLTGRAYSGHVFWDTEIYMLPFYLLTEPAAARALLMYRYHTLGAARRKAAARGYRGALYAWESAGTGEETAPQAVATPDGRIIRILTGEQEHHVSADVAYAVHQYWRATGDDDFMLNAGGDILIETARFWASRAQMEDDGRAHIRAVIGPDEYHEGIDDNAYTNVMARWNLNRAADAVAVLQRKWPADWKRLSMRIGLEEDEPTVWRRIADALVIGFHAETGLFEQFEGYFGLAEADVAAYESCGVPIDLCLGPERTRQSKAIKQADVVALSALLWDEWPRAVHEANFNYYEPRTAHGSSLSPAIYALVAARLGYGERALHYFRQAGEVDLANNMGNAAGGVHMAALAGLWQAAVFGVTGLRLQEEGLAFDPHLPPGWTEMRCSVQWRGCLVRVTLQADPARIGVEVEGPGELTIAVVDGPSRRACSGRRYVIDRGGSAWEAWREASP
jgi:trehalose/maltose hydrolase-like predicted phosphorylase